MLKLSDLYSAQVTGHLEHGALTFEFPISIERAAKPDEGSILAGLLHQETELREELARVADDTQTLLARAESIATPSTESVVDFQARVSGALVGVVVALSDVDGEGQPKEPMLDEARQLAETAFGSLDKWGESLLITPDQQTAAREAAIAAMKEQGAIGARIARDLHDLKAQRIAFWCPDWRAQGDGETEVAVDAAVLRGMSPDLLGKLEEEIEKKAPGRSLSR